MKESIIIFFKEVLARFSWTRIWFIVGIFFIIILLGFGGLVAYAYSFKDKVMPNVYLGEIGIGGMTSAKLNAFLKKMDNKLVDEGIHFKYSLKGVNKDFTVFPLITTGGDSIDLVQTDVDKEVPLLLAYKKGDDIFSRVGNLFGLFISRDQIKLQTVTVDEARFLKIIKDNLAGEAVPPRDASFLVSSINPLAYQITSSSPGMVFDYLSLGKTVADLWSQLKVLDITIHQEEKQPAVLESDVVAVASRLPNVFLAGDLQLQYIDPETRREYIWLINLTQIKNWLNVQKIDNGEFVIGLKQDTVKEFLKKTVAPDINVEPQDAKFKMDESGKVIEFKGSRPGLTVDVEQMYNLINQAIIERTWHDQGLTKVLQLLVAKVEPNVKIGDVNDLGIKDLLGVGVSDYSNSPTNRTKNIRNAVNKLNGILIKPGEEFSTLKFTAPFTLEGGYFPELVIKGDEMKREVGGGLCQIGTTLFRMALNSGMQITERRNHSLVINHYMDPVNRNPGTDATVYDPAPDFRFLNDTGNYLLVQTSMNTKKSELVFTLWGTSDGRVGSYSHPLVSKWYPTGEPKNIETSQIPVGTKQCQNAFRGADASFVYTRVLVDGKKEEKIFESHYRALRKICLIGVVASSTSSGDGSGSVSGSSSADLIVAQ